MSENKKDNLNVMFEGKREKANLSLGYTTAKFLVGIKNFYNEVDCLSKNKTKFTISEQDDKALEMFSKELAKLSKEFSQVSEKMRAQGQVVQGQENAKTWENGGKNEQI